MAVNQSHTENRRSAYIPHGESNLNQCNDVDLSFPVQPHGTNLFSGTKRGILLLTSYRVIFVTSHTASDPMLSFMMPFDLISDCTIEQPVFSSIYIKGNVRAAPGGGWEGQATFKLAFRKGGAIKFYQLMMKAASAAAQGTPLHSVTYWFATPGLVVMTRQGNMMSNQQGPSPACPVVVPGCQYGAPPAGYGLLPPGYGPPPPGYGSFPPGYGPLPLGYGPPPEGSEALPIEYGAPPARNETSPPEYDAPPPRYEAPPARNRAGSHNSVAAQPDGNEASLPSTSSTQDPSPPSKK